MSLPIVAIVGRPNVGKSRLFNRITGRHRAIVDDTAGVTRDRHYAEADWRGKSFMVVDTGGLIPGSEEPLNKKVWGQAFLAIQEADILICVLDGAEGLNPIDQALVTELRKIKKPKFFAVNKIDANGQEKNIYDFSRLGVDPLIAVSAEHGRGVSDLMEALYPVLPATTAVNTPEGVRISIIGRPNVGKSTLLNHLAKEERVVVDEVAGTTRDPIDIVVEKNGAHYVFVDTAGIKRKSTTKTRLEKFSAITSLKVIDRSQLVLLMIDGVEGLTHQDLQLAHTAWEAGKGLLVLVNKWDLVKGDVEATIEEAKARLGELRQVPVLCVSAKTGRNCDLIWAEVARLQKGLVAKIKTSVLNEWIENIVSAHEPPLYKGRNVRLYYGTQVGTQPPRIVLFTNEPQGIPASYARYLKNQFAEAMELTGIPIWLSFRQKGGSRHKGKSK